MEDAKRKVMQERIDERYEVLSKDIERVREDINNLRTDLGPINANISPLREELSKLHVTITNSKRGVRTVTTNNRHGRMDTSYKRTDTPYKRRHHYRPIFITAKTSPTYWPVSDVRCGRLSTFLIKSSEDVSIPAGKNALIKTGISGTVPKNHQMVFTIHPKYAEMGLIVTYGVVDHIETKEWTARVQNLGQDTVHIKSGNNVLHGTVNKILMCSVRSYDYGFFTRDV
jgi:hypothetical protein